MTVKNTLATLTYYSPTSIGSGRRPKLRHCEAIAFFKQTIKHPLKPSQVVVSEYPISSRTLTGQKFKPEWIIFVD